MKKILLILVVFFTTLSCDVLNPPDECEELAYRDSNTIFGATVYTIQQHSRISGIDVKLETWKVHCDGSIGKIPGNVNEGVTVLGSYDVLYYYGYTYKTLEDEIHFKATISKNGEIIDTSDYVYSYNSLAPRELDIKFYIDKKYDDTVYGTKD